MLKVNFNLIITVTVISMLAACKKEQGVVPIQATTYKDLPADPGTKNSQGETVGTTGKYTLFSFKTGQIVANTDSVSNKWDIGFRSTSIIFNSSASGPGTTTAMIVSATFDDYHTAPEEGYSSDEKLDAGKKKYVITPSSGKGWYLYQGPPTHLITPIAGKVIVIKTSENRYAKMEILSYYKGAPTTPSSTTDLDRYYTFRFVYQSEDTREFKK